MGCNGAFGFDDIKIGRATETSKQTNRPREMAFAIQVERRQDCLMLRKFQFN